MASSPRTRLDCLPHGPNEARPCPWTACRHHIQATAQEGQSQTWSCVLDAVDARGAMGQLEVGDILGMSRQHVEYIERSALKKLLRADRRLAGPHQGWTGEEREPEELTTADRENFSLENCSLNTTVTTE